MRKPLSMKRLHVMAANYLIEKGSIPKGKENDEQYKMNQTYILEVMQPEMLDFLKYVWEHKDDEYLLERIDFRSFPKDDA